MFLFTVSHTICCGNIVIEDEDEQVNRCQLYSHARVIVQVLQHSGRSVSYLSLHVALRVWGQNNLNDRLKTTSIFVVELMAIQRFRSKRCF